MKTPLSRKETLIRNANQPPTIPYVDRGRITEEELTPKPEPPVLEIKVRKGVGKKVFEATLKDWDIGVPFGDGNTIEESINDFLEAIWLKWYDKDFELEEIKYKWS